MMREEAGGKWVMDKAGDLAGAVVVNLPMESTTQAIHRNRAMLIVAAADPRPSWQWSPRT